MSAVIMLGVHISRLDDVGCTKNSGDVDFHTSQYPRVFILYNVRIEISIPYR